MAAFGLPQGTPEEKAAREEAIQAATRGAIEVPLRVMEVAEESFAVIQAMAEIGNPASVSDAGVGGACALAAAEGAALNVRINLPGLTEEKVAAEIASRMGELLEQAREKAEGVRLIVDGVLEE